jgi:hypothetical protein
MRRGAAGHSGALALSARAVLFGSGGARRRRSLFVLLVLIDAFLLVGLIVIVAAGHLVHVGGGVVAAGEGGGLGALRIDARRVASCGCRSCGHHRKLLARMGVIPTSMSGRSCQRRDR